MIDISALEVLLRCSSAIVLTVAAVLIGYLLYRDEFKHRFLWKYLGAVITAVAVWRWVIVLALRDDIFPWINTVIADWAHPITQALYILIGLSFIVMALVHRGADD